MVKTLIVDSTGVTIGIYGGHDELSTAYGFPTPNGVITDCSGPIMADDFLTSPVVHVKWWGSYLYNNNAAVPPQPPVALVFRQTATV